jgi:hypothetical protein
VRILDFRGNAMVDCYFSKFQSLIFFIVVIEKNCVRGSRRCAKLRMSDLVFREESVQVKYDCSTIVQ